MHNNSPRMGMPLKSQTPPSIGPTTYIICDERSKLKNRVPFLSTGGKDPTFMNKTFCNTFYSLPECPDSKLGSSPRNKAPRFTFAEDDTPGPGEYDPEEPRCPNSSRRPPSRGRLYVCRVPFTLKGCGPSIPTKINENGYNLDSDGNVIPMPPDERKECSFYNIAERPAYLDRYKGCKWSQRTAKRCFADPKDGPSPTDYDVRLPKCPRDVKNDEFREMARLLTFLPRYLEARDIQLKRENLPGPGQYDIPVARRQCKSCPGIYPRPFIRGSPRFKENVADNPSPDAYDVAEASMKECRISTKPFLIGANRFSKKQTAKTPGPAEYCLHLRKRDATLSQAPFNNSAARNTVDMKKDAADTPSPADYSLANGKKCKIFVSSVFKSKVNRFPKRCSKSNEMSPAHYDPTDAFKYSKNRQSHNVLALPFNVVGKKMGVLDSLNYDNPSPADYVSQGRIGCKGHFIPITERFTDARESTPGPGTYWIHPSFENNCVNRAFASHNLKFKEDILRTPLRYHVDETREKWTENLKKQKKMRWFVNEGKGFSHCV